MRRTEKVIQGWESGGEERGEGVSIMLGDIPTDHGERTTLRVFALETGLRARQDSGEANMFAR